MSLVKLQHISVQFGTKTILTDITLNIRKGEIVTVIGPNGAGKSTLAKVVLKLISPNTGTVTHRPKLRMGYMPQGLLIEPYMPLSVLRFLQIVPRVSNDFLYAVIEQLQIRDLLSTPMQRVSGGERQRVLLARALLQKPDLLVLDEPVQGVDVTGQTELYRLIVTIRDQYQCGILMVSHDLYLVMRGTDSVICLNKHICCSGTPAMVSQHPEFLNLFGESEASKLMFYAHQHNHTHHLDGEICP